MSLEKVKDKGKTRNTAKKEVGLFKRFFHPDSLRKSNRVAVVYLRDNNLVEFKEIEARDGQFVINGRNYHIDRDCIYTTRKERVPLIILREWDLIPLGTKRWEDEDIRERFSKLERHVLQGIKNAELYKVRMPGTQMPTNLRKIIGIGIGLIIFIAILVHFVHH